MTTGLMYPLTQEEFPGRWSHANVIGEVPVAHDAVSRISAPRRNPFAGDVATDGVTMQSAGGVAAIAADANPGRLPIETTNANKDFITTVLLKDISIPDITFCARAAITANLRIRSHALN